MLLVHNLVGYLSGCSMRWHPYRSQGNNVTVSLTMNGAALRACIEYDIARVRDQ